MPITEKWGSEAKIISEVSVHVLKGKCLVGLANMLGNNDDITNHNPFDGHGRLRCL